MPLNERLKQKRKRILTCGILIAVLLLFIVFLAVFSVREVTVEGNSRYTQEEIEELVLGKGYSNTLLLALKSRYQGFDPIPFISTLKVDMVSAGHVRITIYEKTIVGYVEYMGTHLYFDKDGIVVESSREVLENVVEIEGLDFSHMVLHQQLPVEDEDIFNYILNLTQMLIKHELPAEKIEFDEDWNATVCIGSIRFAIGEDEYLNEKVARISDLLPQTTGLSGTFFMEDVTADTDTFRFEKD